MITLEQTESHFKEMENFLMDPNNRKAIFMSYEWANQVTPKAGVYVGFEGNEVVYTGESGSIRGRMGDLLDSRHHNLRRNLGRYNFSNLSGYKDATTKKKFPPDIEREVDSWLNQKIKISIFPTDIGRIEMKERLIEKFNPKYNQKRKRNSD